MLRAKELHGDLGQTGMTTRQITEWDRYSGVPSACQWYSLALPLRYAEENAIERGCGLGDSV